MKVSINWLEELVENVNIEEVERLLPLRSIATKEITDDFIELDMKGYNRADLLSMRGVALEVAAITDSKVNFNELKEEDYVWVEKGLDSTPVHIEDEKLCSVQAVARIEGLKVKKSDLEWVKKLADSGMRSINNITDVTNLVMLEYGHPLHSFDASTVKDQTINVRRAKEGEEIVTLDGKLRKLTSEDIVLADTEKALDVAGVMGGKDTEIKDDTTTILLSASLFNPEMIRRTSSRLKLPSEASKRFYHGLTKKRLLQALDAAIRMYQELGGELTALTIVGTNGEQLKKIPLSLKKVNDLIGVDLTEEQIEMYLEKLYFNVGSRVTDDPSNSENVSWVVTPPYFRLDIEIEEDLVEEVARMYGYENIKPKELKGELPEKINQTLFKLIRSLKNSLVEQGLTEVQTYSFFSTKVLEALGFDENSKKVLVKVANPMSKETEYLRMNLWPNLVEVIDKNIRQGFDDIAIFEIGKEYMIQEDKKPFESHTLAIAITNGGDNPLAEINQIFEKSITSIISTTGTTGGVTVKEDRPPEVLKHLFHPNRFVSIYKDGEKIGGMAEVHPKVIHSFGFDKRVAILQVDLGSLV